MLSQEEKLVLLQVAGLIAPVRASMDGEMVNLVNSIISTLQLPGPTGASRLSGNRRTVKHSNIQSRVKTPPFVADPTFSPQQELFSFTDEELDTGTDCLRVVSRPLLSSVETEPSGSDNSKSSQALVL